MILNRKAKEDFKKWYIETYDLYDSYDNELKLMSDTCLNALIIEFFDEIGVHINSFYRYTWRIEIRDFRANLLSNLDFADFESRQQATEQAIKKANDIYNERNEL